ncbi:uncharacterized protein PAC_13266 [Phialocephala subalpina]|uniref:Uncharacterized protein n=1 Tax=Phialocephala subalpina TaxID=576137 RepID=A0A1L7XE92_9HELO|nr:uncharacterized protein PAC_13266 [Phialocephala subalpina]
MRGRTLLTFTKESLSLEYPQTTSSSRPSTIVREIFVSSITLPTSSTSPQMSSPNLHASSSSSAPSNAWTNQTPSTTPLRYGGLSTGLKAAIAIGVIFVLLLFAGLGAFIFWYLRHSANRRKTNAEPTTEHNAEIAVIKYLKEMEDTSVPPYDIGNFDWGQRRGAVELESPISPYETVSDRAELEALRKKSMAPVEMEG